MSAQERKGPRVRKLGVIVEGQGDALALPWLLRRLGREVAPGVGLEIVGPFRLPRGKIVKEDELKRHVALLAEQASPGGSILVLCDADKDCPAKLGPSLLRWAREARSDRPCAAVLAKFEFEAWFLAAARSLAGHHGLPEDLEPPPNPEVVRDAKGWLSDKMGRPYSETAHQAEFCKLMDLEQARAAPSFEKLRRDLARLLAPP